MYIRFVNVITMIDSVPIDGKPCLHNLIQFVRQQCMVMSF